MDKITRPADALKLMLENPNHFRAVKRDLDKQARALMKKQVKAIRTAGTARALAEAVGEPAVMLGLEALTARDAGILARRFDRHNRAISEMSLLEQRQHLYGLVSGEIEPRPEPANAPKPKVRPRDADVPKPVTEADKIFRHKSMGARRKSRAEREAGE